MCCCIATFLNSACTVAVVYSKVTEMRESFVENDYQCQETSLRPDISVTRAEHVICPLLVTPAQLMKPGIGRNTSCALDDFHF
jgi:hypothetical protein